MAHLPYADRVVPAALWDRLDASGVGPVQRALYLALFCAADSDGVVPVSPRAAEAACGCRWALDPPLHDRLVEAAWAQLELLYGRGLVLPYRTTPGEAWWCWLPEAMGAGPPLRPEQPPPPPDLVAVLLGRRGEASDESACRRACPRAFGLAPAPVPAPPAPSAPPEDAVSSVQVVWEAWRVRQAAPDRCRFTSAVRRLIKGALAGASCEELLLLLHFAYEADEPAARYWRGENDRGRTYLGLDNLLVASKLQSRVQLALAWALKGEDEAGGVAGYRPGPLSAGELARGRENGR